MKIMTSNGKSFTFAFELFAIREQRTFNYK